MTNIEKLDRALSIRQPHVEMILRGEKRAEYRSRPTCNRGRFYLYASKQLSFVATAFSSSELNRLPRGFIVGSVEICDCERYRDGYAWLLANPIRYDAVFLPTGQPQPAFWRPLSPWKMIPLSPAA